MEDVVELVELMLLGVEGLGDYDGQGGRDADEEEVGHRHTLLQHLGQLLIFLEQILGIFLLLADGFRNGGGVEGRERSEIIITTIFQNLFHFFVPLLDYFVD